MNNHPFENAPVIFRYSRAQALEDGVLIDLTAWAREVGFRIPLACTAAVWNECIEPPAGTRELGQSERGRAHDLLWMLYLAIRRQADARSDRLEFEVIFLRAPEQQNTVALKSLCGPGDHAEPVLTIMLPNED